MKCKWTIVAVALLILCATAFDNANAQTHFGVRGGVYLDQDHPYVGAHFVSKVQRNLMFNPNFEYVLVDRGSLFTINADFHYDLPSRSSTIFWLGGGLGISRFSFEDFSNTDTGLNLLMGVSFSRRPVIPFIQVKVMVMDDTQLVFGGGLTF